MAFDFQSFDWGFAIGLISVLGPFLLMLPFRAFRKVLDRDDSE